MKILVLNCGSTSIKYKLFDMDEQKVLAQGGIEKIGLHDSFLKITLPNDEKVILEKFIPEHTVGVEFIFEQLTSAKYGCIKSLKEIDAVGHRVVHGGEKFSQAVRITPKVLEEIKSCSELAPLHNPANIKGINAISKILPDVPQVAVFDTSFHQTMPNYAYMYALPYTYYEKYGVRRYGFHGTSHSYVSKRACEFLGLNYNSTKIITAHIGGGGSIAAIKDGKSIDTSMGMTPVEGLMMGTRSGNVDLGVIMFLMEKEHLTAEDISTIVNKKSGIKGISGISSDMRDIEKAVAEGNQRAALALNMFNYRILKHIGAFAAILNGVDVLVFTGGVGENQSETRRYVCEGLSYLGVEIDSKANKSRGQEIELSTKNSKVRVVVIPTNEEFMIASDTKELI
ncbi:MAG: acetate kinase [Paludibacteraceae bacterium]|jgi:acetate kinase|nr:acetate kinase [Paludibacteraceae bacterium]MDI9536750.1 acetate kinase [Bacteroidota bacterium]OQC33870.1 MAG: Acetate kinase [Bacteroidetes bacterium ADurb.Bin057]HHT60526.1 acetate kinase [Bacteroidales bacterium]MBP9039851.1 acetate kinase [Paludibacteraceae bacterium]